MPPAARMAATVSARLSALTSMQATLAPAAASDWAMHRPSPRAAPVTRAVCPLRLVEIRLVTVESRQLSVVSCSSSASVTAQRSLPGAQSQISNP